MEFPCKIGIPSSRVLIQLITLWQAVVWSWHVHCTGMGWKFIIFFSRCHFLYVIKRWWFFACKSNFRSGLKRHKCSTIPNKQELRILTCFVPMTLVQTDFFFFYKNLKFLAILQTLMARTSVYVCDGLSWFVLASAAGTQSR